MKNLNNLYKLSVTIIIITSSCKTAYIPNRVNTPLFTEKGEFQASASIGFSGFDPQIAYAATDNIGLMVNGSFASTSNTDGEETIRDSKHRFIEFAGGYYNSSGSVVRYEAYGGYGFGRIDTDDYSSSVINTSVHSSYARLFLQPGIGATTKVFDGSISPRLVFVRITPDEDVDFDYSTGFVPFIEPVLTARLGYHRVKFITQFGFSISLQESISFGYRPIILNLGLQLSLGK